MAEKLKGLFHCMWRKEAIPQEFKDAFIFHLSSPVKIKIFLQNPKQIATQMFLAFW